jgi:pimeloyl-ACP methyl ester carboxylesterase
MYPAEVEQLTLMDAFLPGIGAWRDVYDAPGPWHFRFYGHTPELLVKGRERTYFEHFWNDFAADPKRSIPEADRRAYAKAYARPGRMAAGFAYFQSFQKTADDFAELGKTKLPMPVSTIGGEKANGDALGAQAKFISANPTVVIIKDAGHWILEEKTDETIAAVTDALDHLATAQK